MREMVFRESVNVLCQGCWERVMIVFKFGRFCFDSVGNSGRRDWDNRTWNGDWRNSGRVRREWC